MSQTSSITDNKVILVSSRDAAPDFQILDKTVCVDGKPERIFLPAAQFMYRDLLDKNQYGFIYSEPANVGDQFKIRGTRTTLIENESMFIKEVLWTKDVTDRYGTQYRKANKIIYSMVRIGMYN